WDATSGHIPLRGEVRDISVWYPPNIAPPTTASAAAVVSVEVSSGQPSTATEHAATARPTDDSGPGRLPDTMPIATGTAADMVPSRTAATPTGRPREKQR